MLLEVTTWSWDLSVLASIRFSRTPVCLEGGGGGGGGGGLENSIRGSGFEIY